MKKLLFSLSVLLLTFGCQQMEPGTADFSQMENESQQTNVNYTEKTASVALEEEELIEVNRFKNLKIIKTGSMTFEVDDFQKTRDKLDDLIASHGGFVANEKADKPNDRMQTTITVKLLPEQFYPFLKSIEPLAMKVYAKNIHTSDATQEYTDLEARLKAKEDVAARFKAILKRANTIDEIFTVEEKLRYVLEEIESTKGRIRYLSEQVGLSTVTITVFQYLQVADIAEAGFFTKLGHAFTFGWNDILEVVLDFAANWHLFLFWGTILFFGFRWFRIRALVRQLVGK